MARRPSNSPESSFVPSTVQRHMKAMGILDVDAYFGWCSANGFTETIEKSRGDLQSEFNTYNLAVARQKQHLRLHKKPKVFLEAVCCGELRSDEIDRPDYKRIATEIEASNESAEVRMSLLEMLSVLSQHKDLVFGAASGREDQPFIRGLIKFHDRKQLWLRELTDWKPKSKNAIRQFGELSHHLFDNFGDVPTFMELVWLRNDQPSRRYRDWYVHLGRGYNLRTAKCPITVTKKIAHAFLHAPDDFTVEQALRFGQLSAFGANRNAINATVATQLARSFVQEKFWVTVLRVIAENPMLDPRQIGPLIDYLHSQRFERTEIEVAPGQWRQEPPPQPGLSMRGRTIDGLLRQVEIWHRNLGRQSGRSGQVYLAAEFNGIAIQKKSSGKPVKWAIRQLRSSNDLQIESKELRHCVASYHWSCARGNCTIWNLSRSENDGTYERRQTIEVDKNRTVVQCRGLANRDPTKEEWSIVTDWAREAGLQVAAYL